MNKKYTAYLQRVFIPVSRYVKVVKIHQDFPDLWLQMYCLLFMVHSVYWAYFDVDIKMCHAVNPSFSPNPPRQVDNL